MENKSKLKYYLSGLIILVIIILVIVLSRNNKSITQQPQVQNASPISTSELIGTWVSSTQGKGMQGSGKITFRGTTYQINFTGDINLVVGKVENNTATGTITFDNLCLTTSSANRPAQCVKSYTEPAVMQVVGNTINYTGPTVLGASISLTGKYTHDSIMGTFTRTSTSGTTTGTFSLARANKL